MNPSLEDSFRIGRIVDWTSNEQLRVTLGEPNRDSKVLSIPRNELQRMHCHFRGKTRSGKTSRCLIPYMQMLLLQECMLCIFDLGGDLSLLKTARSEAEGQGRKFRFFSLNPLHESNWFDPFDALGKSSRTAIAISEYLVAALSCEHGLGYGSLFFSMANLSTLLAAAKKVEESGDAFCLAKAVEAIEKNSKKDGEQVRMMLCVLLEFVQLQEQEGVEAIDFAEAIENGDVCYFWLPSLVGAMSARQVAGLALYGIVAAAMRRVEEGREDKHTFVLCDEFQEIAGRNFSALMSQAAKFNVTFMLANQTTDQLKTSDTDLTSIVSDNTGLKVYFTVTTKEDFEALQLLSKERITWLKSESIGTSSPFGTVTQREVIAPIISKNLILEVSATEGYAFVVLDNGEGHLEPQVVYLDYGLTKEVHAEKYVIPRRDPSEIVTKPVVGVHVPYEPEWQKDCSDNEEWQARQRKLALLWEDN